MNRYTAAALVAAFSFSLIAQATAEIRIAVVGPMTGQYAAFGDQMHMGAAMAVKDINDNGGLLGQEVVLEVGDDVCDPKQAVAEANRLVGRETVFVAGHACSGSSIPASKVYQEEGVLMITPASTSPLLTEEGGDMIFRVAGRDDQQGRVAADYLKTHFAGARIAILHDKSAYGRGLADQTRKGLHGHGITEVLYEAYTAGEKDFGALVAKLKAADVDFIYVGGYHTESALILRQAREAGLLATLMAGDGLMSADFWSIAGKAAEGTLMTFNPDPRRNPAAKEVVARFAQSGIEPEGYTLSTYATVQIWAAAVALAGTVEPGDVADALRLGAFDTVLGEIKFDHKGDVRAPGYVVYRWSQGAYDYAEN